MHSSSSTRPTRSHRGAHSSRARLGRCTPVALAIFVILRGAQAAEPAADENRGSLEEITVTATKRVEDQQSVPISIQAISEKSLQQQNLQSFNDYAQQLTSVSFQSATPGFAIVSMRGISSGSGGNSSGSLPTVGMYLDEQPITTIAGAIDVHVYDIARVEVLPGPQGTLYGASSESGTIKVVTNKPDVSHFSAGYDVQGNFVKNGTLGGIVEGFVNIPIAPNIAARLVGWYEHDSGYIDAVAGTATSNGHTYDNAGFVKDHANPVDVYGGRLAFKIDLNDNWSVSPTFMAQNTQSQGIFAQEYWRATDIAPAFDHDLAERSWARDFSNDSWIDAAMTVQGKVGNFDITYAGSYLKRHTYGASDYADYQFAYQQYTQYWPADYGFVNFPTSRYQQYSNELRVASPKDLPVRFLAGLYQQRQLQDIYNNIATPMNTRPQYEVGYPNPPNGYGGTEYLLDEQRVNRDTAVFGEVTWDITSKLSLLGGLRRFKYDNSLEGFYGFGINAFGPPPPPLFPGGPPGPGGTSGEQTCKSTHVWSGGIQPAPCENINTSTTGTGWTPKVNVSYKITDQALVYATYSKGFRPGGVNRTNNAPPYTPDFLKNYEVGWKSMWFDNRLRVNGSVYYEKWNDFQFTFKGKGGIPAIANAGNAAVKGADVTVEWAATRDLTLHSSVTYADALLLDNYCGALGADGAPITSNPCLVPGKAPFTPKSLAGTQLPGTPKFKTNAGARFEFPIGDWQGHAQGDLVYQTSVSPQLLNLDSSVLGPQRAYALTNFFVGAEKNGLSVELLVKNAFDRRASLYRYANCGNSECAVVATYEVVAQPRLIGVQVGQRF
ncbi:MAG: TonB-dependent receptor [Gammaproteobacteria bacterium]